MISLFVTSNKFVILGLLRLWNFLLRLKCIEDTSWESYSQLLIYWGGNIKSCPWSLKFKYQKVRREKRRPEKLLRVWWRVEIGIWDNLLWRIGSLSGKWQLLTASIKKGRAMTALPLHRIPKTCTKVYSIEYRPLCWLRSYLTFLNIVRQSWFSGSARNFPVSCITAG